MKVQPFKNPQLVDNLPFRNTKEPVTHISVVLLENIPITLLSLEND